jgi:serine/threonine-protein kinase
MLARMPAASARPSALRAPLDAALEDELARIERRIARVWQILGVAGVTGSLILGLRSSRSLALWGSLAALAYLAWFTVEAELLRRRRGSRALRTVTTAVESTVPWAFLGVMASTQGAAYALGSWVPPLLFGGLIISSTARLRPVDPLIIGVSSGLVFPFLYFLWLRPALPPELATLPLFQPQIQISRGVSLALAGVLAWMIAGALRSAIGKAESTVRERELFGKYRLLKHLASGGMGTVFEALYCPEGGFERTVAVKRIHPHLASEARFITFFRNEAELSARLVHPNIVQVLDFGSVDGTYFLAMELVSGLTLQAFMKRAWAAKLALPPRLVAHLGHEILAGLAYSHTAARAADGSLLRVIHRDICPANLLISRNGEVKISDFGVARALRQTGSDQTRTVAGHSGYMAPEQARALPFDERCDLFSVGVILWELVCGKPLFHRGGEGPTLLAVMSADVPRPTGSRDDIHPGWDAFIERALARDPGERFPSATAMSTALAELTDARGCPSTEELTALVAHVLTLPDPSPSDEATLDHGAEQPLASATLVGDG